MKYYLCLDLGGTKTSVALFHQNGMMADDFVHVVASRTFKGESAVYDNTKGAVNFILDKYKLTFNDLIGIGVGCPGPLDVESGIIINAPLMGWNNFPLKKKLTEDFHVPVMIDNDGNLGALAEQRCGIAKGLKQVIYVTVSTGVGAGIIIDGEIYHGKSDGAGEFGHLSIDQNGRECPCGSKGCLELYCSGTAIKNTLRQDEKKGIKSPVFQAAREEGKQLDAKLLARFAAQNDTYAVKLFEKIGWTLGYGLSYLFNLFDPEVVVIGGGVSKSHQFFEQAVRKALKQYTIIAVKDSQVVYSQMCDTVVLFGAYYLIKESIERGG
ncbi:ROK family protein [Faecalicatena contorta]|uniref:ROK family protein n=1 Tax=Faecalicatena contorta TaxID=39482 RepID=UPI00129D28FE|nr:ROK family protein [Faecalicatena contorta]MEE0200388.1 ROK family protein [Muricomes sp.]MRM88397.1 ROK family protein [Faecalicatena contorta]